MSNYAWRHGCDCCGKMFMVSLDANPNGTRCGMCTNRGGLCMHNVFERYRGLEPGTFKAEMHSSRIHRDATGADDPSTCQWCLAKLLDREEA